MLIYSVVLSEERMQLADRLAEASHQRWAAQQGNYENTRHNHLLGRVGEIGVFDMLSGVNARIEPHFLNDSDEGLCDITANDVNLEVKTWTSGLWNQFGRAVAVNQYDRVAAKASLIVWCTWNASTREVRIMGCSAPVDVLQEPAQWTGPVAGRKIHNYQLSPWRIMPPNVLAEAIGVRSGSERLVSRAHRAMVRADAIEIIDCNPVNAKVRWIGKTISCTNYLPVEGSNVRTGCFPLAGQAWEDFVERIHEDSALSLSFTEDGNRIVFHVPGASFEMQVSSGFWAILLGTEPGGLPCSHT